MLQEIMTKIVFCGAAESICDERSYQMARYPYLSFPFGVSTVKKSPIYEPVGHKIQLPQNKRWPVDQQKQGNDVGDMKI